MPCMGTPCEGAACRGRREVGVGLVDSARSTAIDTQSSQNDSPMPEAYLVSGKIGWFERVD